MTVEQLVKAIGMNTKVAFIDADSGKYVKIKSRSDLKKLNDSTIDLIVPVGFLELEVYVNLQ